jgi:carbonic anhydrase
MSNELQAVLKANADYAARFGERSRLQIPPARRMAILTCMDARMDPAQFAGLKEGDAHVIRNAGGRASDDAIRSLVISYKLLGTREWLVIQHTNCGMLTFTDEVMRDLLSKSLKTASFDGKAWRDPGGGPGSDEGRFINWLTLTDLAAGVVADVRRIRNHPLVPADIVLHGFIFDVRTGRLEEVPGAREAARNR